MTAFLRRAGPRFVATARFSLLAVVPLSPAAPAQTTSVPVAQTSTVEVSDVAGRTVRVRAPAERVVLGEGRQIYFVAALRIMKMALTIFIIMLYCKLSVPDGDKDG